MKFTFDNNFLHYFKKLPIKDKNKAVSLVKNKRIEFLLTDILIFELLGLIGKNNEKLKEHCSIIKDLNCVKIFKSVPRIIYSEIKGKYRDIFQSSKNGKIIHELILKLASVGKIDAKEEQKIISILLGPRDYMNDWKNDQEANIKKIRVELKKRIVKSKRKDEEKKFTKEEYNEFLEKGFDFYYALKNEKKISHLYNFLKINKLFVPKNTIKKIVDDEKYPIANTWLRCKFALHYKHIKENYSQIKANSLNDILYLIYVPEVDFLVSDDKLVSSIGEIIYKDLKVLKFREFLGKIK